MSPIAGVRDFRTIDPITLFYKGQLKNDIKISGVIDASRAVDGAYTGNENIIRPGFFMAYNSSNKRWVPCKRTTIAQDAESSATGEDTHFTVTDARNFQAGDSVTIGSTAGFTVTTVDYANNVIVVSTTYNASDGDAIFETNEGLARAILIDEVNLHDDEGADRDVEVRMIVCGGLILPSMLKGDDVAIRAASGMKIGNFQFTDDHGLGT